MKNTLTKAFLCCFISLFTLQSTTYNAHATETTDDLIELTVEINDVNAIYSIKEQLIDSSIDIQQDQSIKDEIDIVNSEITIDGLDITQLGTTTGQIHMSLKLKPLSSTLLAENTISTHVIFNVVDTTKPEITLKYSAIQLDFEEELNPYEWIKNTSDNSMNDLASVYAETSSLDNTTPGDYTVYYYAKDASGNTATTELKVTVKEEINASAYYGTDANLINDMLDLINSERSERGLSPLILGSENAQKAIGVRASEASGYVSHTRPDGQHYKTAFDEYGVTYSSPYEVLTYSGTTVQDKLDWWMGSPGHRDILMRATGTYIAIGYSGSMWAAIVYN